MVRTTRSTNQEETSHAKNDGNILVTPRGTPLTVKTFMQALSTFGQANQPKCVEAQERNCISEVMKLARQSFSGTVDPIEAEGWLIEI